jgi:hypothetical protein
MKKEEINQCYFCETMEPYNDRFYSFHYIDYGFTEIICPQCFLTNIPNANWNLQHACVFCKKDYVYEDLSIIVYSKQFLTLYIIQKDKKTDEFKKIESATISCKTCFKDNIGLYIGEKL